MDDDIEETYTVKFIRDADTDQIFAEHWYDSRGVHRNPKGAATTHYDQVTGNPTLKMFGYRLDRNGKPLPTSVAYDPHTGNRKGESYTNKLHEWHREDGPARIFYDPETGEIKQQRYYRNNIETDEFGNPLDTSPEPSYD